MFNEKMLIAFLVSFLVTVAVMPVLIPYLRKLKFGQQILEDGPKWHEKKSGTPTMGGIGFIVGISFAMIIASVFEHSLKLVMLALISFGFGAIGFVDDYIKVVKNITFGSSSR